MRRHIPNLFTLGNLLCGMLSIAFSFEGQFDWAVYLIGFSAALDFFDGLMARWLKVSGPLGVQLDSLADVVSFGVAPAFMLSLVYVDIASPPANDLFQNAAIYFPYTIALASAYRLAVFNLDESQHTRFFGLPTPANALFIVSMVWGVSQGEWPQEWMGCFNAYGVVVLSVLSSWLMISRLPLISLKFKTFVWKGNEARWILLILSAAILFTLRVSGLAIVVLLYLVISTIENLRKR